MTWPFVYLMLLIVGLVLAGVTGLFRSVRLLGGHHRHLVVPHPDHCFSFNVEAARVSVGLTVVGLVGLVLSGWEHEESQSTLTMAVAAGAVATLLSFLVIRKAVASLASRGQATVVRDIAPGGYGQICFGSHGGGILMAARSSNHEMIPAGALVEVVEAEHSVVTVRRLTQP